MVKDAAVAAAYREAALAAAAVATAWTKAAAAYLELAELAEPR